MVKKILHGFVITLNVVPVAIGRERKLNINKLAFSFLLRFKKGNCDNYFYDLVSLD